MTTTTTKKKTRKPQKFILGWVTEADCETDPETGKPIAGTGRRCFVELPFPPGLDEKGQRDRNAIMRACKKAVFEHHQEEYGNKDLVVLAYTEFFSVPFEKKEIHEVRLVPPPESSAPAAE